MKIKEKKEQSPPKTTQEYQEEIRRISEVMEKQRTIYYLVIIVIAAIVLMIVTLKYITQKNSDYIVINANEITTSTSSKTECAHSVSTKYAYTTNGIDYYEVVVGPTKSIWTKEQVDSLIGENTQIRTAIYEATFTNKDKFIGSLASRKLKLVRYSIKGESEFTPDELEAYKPLAAYYFTEKKAHNLSLDEEEYKQELRNQNLYKGLFVIDFEEISDKLVTYLEKEQKAKGE